MVCWPDVEFDEFKSWWDRNIESNESADPIFAQLRAKLDSEAGKKKLTSLKNKLARFTGRATDAFMQALYDKEETLFRHMNRMRQKEEELGRLNKYHERLEEVRDRASERILPLFCSALGPALPLLPGLQPSC